jgi:hypothetical protein
VIGGWKEAFVTHVKILSQHLSGGTEDYHEKPQFKCPYSTSRIEPGTFRIQSDVQRSAWTDVRKQLET